MQHDNNEPDASFHGLTYRSTFFKSHQPLPTLQPNCALNSNCNKPPATHSVSQKSKHTYGKHRHDQNMRFGSKSTTITTAAKYFGNTHSFTSSPETWTSTETKSITTSFIPSIDTKPKRRICTKKRLPSLCKMSECIYEESPLSLSPSISSAIQDNGCSISTISPWPTPPKYGKTNRRSSANRFSINSRLSYSTDSQYAYGGVTADELLLLTTHGHCDSDYDTDVDQEYPPPVKRANTNPIRKIKSKTRVIPSILTLSHSTNINDNLPTISLSTTVSQEGHMMLYKSKSYSMTDESTDDEDKPELPDIASDLAQSLCALNHKINNIRLCDIVD